MFKRRLILAVLLMLWPYALAGAQPASTNAAPGIAVVYPDLGEPFRRVFAKIIDGIESGLGTRVRSLAVGPGTDAARLAEQLRSDKVRVVIALGRQGVLTMSSLQPQFSVIVGGVLLQDAEQRELTGTSYTPDPALLFAQLKRIRPGARRVLVVVNPAINEWLVRLAREAAKAQGMDLIAHEAHDAASAARLYESLIAGADARRDALWLPHDPTTVEESTILPLVLRESWNRSLPVFSSSFFHVKKGALFVLYPNNEQHGRSLAAAALRALAGDVHRGVTALRDVSAAINTRTASHLGLNLSADLMRDFDSVFPEN